jgi:hypothetical protein
VLCICLFLLLFAIALVPASALASGLHGTGNTASVTPAGEIGITQLAIASSSQSPVATHTTAAFSAASVSSAGAALHLVSANNQSSIIPTRTNRISELRQELVQAENRRAIPFPVFRVAIILVAAFAAVAALVYLLYHRRSFPKGKAASGPAVPVLKATVVEPSPSDRPSANIPATVPAVPFPPSLEQKYREIEFIGEGGLARVFRAKRAKDGTLVAVKVPIRYDELTGTHFIRDITLWQGLHHPNIIEIYAANVLPVPYIEMEYTRSSLAAVKFPISENEALAIIRQVARGLAYAHAHGIVHRDIKPENILITDDGTPKITDWGLARPVTDTRQSSVISFSPAYAAPEQLAPGRYGKPGPRTDIYQLGVLLYEMLTGTVPFRNEGLLELNHAILVNTPPHPVWAGTHVDRIRQIMMKCLAKNPDDRYESVAALIAELDSMGQTFPAGT